MLAYWLYIKEGRAAPAFCHLAISSRDFVGEGKAGTLAEEGWMHLTERLKSIFS
jgi:hypothetical protein